MPPRVTTTWKRKKKGQRLGQEASQAKEKGNRNGSHSKNNRHGRSSQTYQQSEYKQAALSFFHAEDSVVPIEVRGYFVL